MILEGLSSEIGLAESGIILKGKVPRFVDDFDHPLSCERPFKCWRHFVEDLEM